MEPSLVKGFTHLHLMRRQVAAHREPCPEAARRSYSDQTCVCVCERQYDQPISSKALVTSVAAGRLWPRLSCTSSSEVTAHNHRVLRPAHASAQRTSLISEPPGLALPPLGFPCWEVDTDPRPSECLASKSRQRSGAPLAGQPHSHTGRWSKRAGSCVVSRWYSPWCCNPNSLASDMQR